MSSLLALQVAQGGLLFTWPSLFLFPSCTWVLGAQLHLPTGGHKSVRDVLLHLPSPPSYAARQSSETPVKWNPSLILYGPTRKQGSTQLVAAVHNHVSTYRATSPSHCRSEVIGRGLPVGSCWYGRKIFTSFKFNLQLLPKMCSSHIIFWKTVNPFDGHDLKLNLT